MFGARIIDTPKIATPQFATATPRSPRSPPGQRSMPQETRLLETVGPNTDRDVEKVLAPSSADSLPSDSHPTRTPSLATPDPPGRRGNTLQPAGAIARHRVRTHVSYVRDCAGPVVQNMPDAATPCRCRKPTGLCQDLGRSLGGTSRLAIFRARLRYARLLERTRRRR